VTQQTIVAYFDTRAEAKTAKAALASAGVALEAIRLLPEEDTTSTYTRESTETSYDYRRDEGGFWKSLGDLFLPDEDRYGYAEGLSRGGAALSVVTDEAHYDEVARVLEENGADNIDEREAEWRSAGWSGYTAPEATAATGTTSDTTTAASLAPRGATAADDDEAIQVVEETLRVGKRQVDKGRVRIRSYVVETPVQEEVSLRAERVLVDRRPVDRLATTADLASAEKTIEAEERVEEAVISKEARVVEEIGLRRDSEEHVETVSDTVRKTEVEVVDERTDGTSTSTGTLPGATERNPTSR